MRREGVEGRVGYPAFPQSCAGDDRCDAIAVLAMWAATDTLQQTRDDS